MPARVETMKSSNDGRDDERERPPLPSRRDHDPYAAADGAALAEFLGRELAREPDAAIWKDERYLAWLRDELRDRNRRERRISDEEFVREGEELMARAQAVRLKLARRERGLRVCEPPAAYVGASMQESLSAPRSAGIPFMSMGIAAGDGRELWDEPVEQWVTLPDEMPDGRYLALRVVGDSMAPLMHSGDRVLVRLGPEVERETVIVARHPDDGYVCKRVAKVGRDRLELASLAPGRPPITVPRRQELILGTVVLVSCGHRSRRGAVSSGGG
jgi:SOS-response transcriptional repressor LexA